MQVLTQEAEESHGGYAHSELCFLLIALNLFFPTTNMYAEEVSLCEHGAVLHPTQNGQGTPRRPIHNIAKIVPLVPAIAWQFFPRYLSPPRVRSRRQCDGVCLRLV